MTEIQDANNRFNTLWEDIGAKRITIGDEDKGVEIVIDADLSIFSILEKLKEESEAIHQKGELSATDMDAVSKAVESIEKILGGGGVVHKRLGDHFREFFHKK